VEAAAAARRNATGALALTGCRTDERRPGPTAV